MLICVFDHSSSNSRSGSICSWETWFRQRVISHHVPNEHIFNKAFWSEGSKRVNNLQPDMRVQFNTSEHILRSTRPGCLYSGKCTFKQNLKKKKKVVNPSSLNLCFWLFMCRFPSSCSSASLCASTLPNSQQALQPWGPDPMSEATCWYRSSPQSTSACIIRGAKPTTLLRTTTEPLPPSPAPPPTCCTRLNASVSWLYQRWEEDGN